MKSFFTIEVNQKILLAAASYSLLWGITVAVAPQFVLNLFDVTLPIGFEFWQLFGLLSGIMGVGYYIASNDADKYWPIVFIGFLGNVFGSLILIKTLFIHSLPLPFSLFLLVSQAIWIMPFYYSLLLAYDTEMAEDSPPKKFSDLIKFVRTSQNVTLDELSQKGNVLLIFVRHFGCMFCRETVAEMAKIESAINGKKLTLVYVHMNDRDFGDEFFAKYYKHPVHHISDPGLALYKSVNLKRGTLNQIFGPLTLMRAFYVGVLKGHGVGAIEADVLQLGGVFLLSKGQIIFEQKAKSASTRFEFNTLPEL